MHLLSETVVLMPVPSICHGDRVPQTLHSSNRNLVTGTKSFLRSRAFMNKQSATTYKSISMGTSSHITVIRSSTIADWICMLSRSASIPLIGRILAWAAWFAQEASCVTSLGGMDCSIRQLASFSRPFYIAGSIAHLIWAPRPQKSPPARWIPRPA